MLSCCNLLISLLHQKFYEIVRITDLASSLNTGMFIHQHKTDSDYSGQIIFNSRPPGSTQWRITSVQRRLQTFTSFKTLQAEQITQATLLKEARQKLAKSGA